MQMKSHTVQFYREDGFLIESVSTFIKNGLKDNATVIVVVTRKHREELLQALVSYPLIGEKLVFLDASELLSTFMVDGRPDEIRFLGTLGRMVQQAAQAGPVCIFGEMVAVLWAEGNSRAAIRLEELWNELAKQQPFSLMCAYPMAYFPDQQDSHLFLQVCQAHTHVGTT